MQKVVIDTNVFVSALIQRSYPFLIVNDLLIEDLIELSISDEVLQEYYQVLSRKKFAKYPDFISRAENILADIKSKAVWVTPKNRIAVISDKDDNRFLELAEESKADFLITGNTNDFTIKVYKRTRIVTPKDYWENFNPRK